MKKKEDEIKIGFKANVNPEEDIFKILGFAIKNGFNCLEIGLSLWPSFNPTLKIAQKIRQISERYGLFLSLHLPYYSPTFSSIIPEISEGVIRMAHRGIALARKLGTKIIILHSGNYESEFHRKKNFENLLLNLKKIWKLGKKCKVKICLENSFKSEALCTKPEDLLRVVKKARGIKINFDIGHANIVSNPVKYFLQIKKYVNYAHIHDNDGRTDQHKLIGEGNIDFKSFLKECKKLNFYGPFILETFPLEKTVKGKERFLNIWKQV